jgi:hypothetical protein
MNIIITNPERWNYKNDLMNPANVLCICALHFQYTTSYVTILKAYGVSFQQ